MWGQLLINKEIVKPVGVKYYRALVTLCMPDSAGFETGWGQAGFSSPYPSRPVLGSTQPPVKRAQVITLGIRTVELTKGSEISETCIGASVTLRRVTSLELKL